MGGQSTIWKFSPVIRIFRSKSMRTFSVGLAIPAGPKAINLPTLILSTSSRGSGTQPSKIATLK
jgi:hypothetical protein